ncbi:MAG: hypothetical protein ACTMHS_12975 [Micrococcaceae bacterium]
MPIAITAMAAFAWFSSPAAHAEDSPDDDASVEVSVLVPDSTPATPQPGSVPPPVAPPQPGLVPSPAPTPQSSVTPSSGGGSDGQGLATTGTPSWVWEAAFAGGALIITSLGAFAVTRRTGPFGVET